MISLKLLTGISTILLTVDVGLCSGVNIEQLSQHVFGTNPNLNSGIQNDKPKTAGEGWDLGDDFVPFEGARDEDFDWGLFKTLSSHTPGNLLISPVSVKLLLMMLDEGARGSTQRELKKLLALPESYQHSRERVNRILTSLKSYSSEYTLNFASRIYVSKTIQSRQRYNAIIKMFYDADLVPIDFADKNAANGVINGWVSNYTNGHIKELVTPGDLETAVLLMLNAIYFRGQWRKQFPVENTGIGEFYVEPDKSITVPFMRQQGVFFYHNSKELDSKILRIPYKGRKYSMFILLPNTKSGLSQLTKDLSSVLLRRHLWLMDEVELNVTLPKFKFDYTAHMKETLQEMGLHEIFSDSASLPGIARGLPTNTRLVVTDLLQKAGIDVNEEGSTVFAATEIVLTNKFGSDRDVEFRATRPFLFFIEDETSGTILFIGKVVNPLLSESNTVATTKPVENPQTNPAPPINNASRKHNRG